MPNVKDKVIYFLCGKILDLVFQYYFLFSVIVNGPVVGWVGSSSSVVPVAGWVGSRINTGVVHVVGVVHLWMSIVTLIVEDLGVSFSLAFAEMVCVAIGVWVGSRINTGVVHVLGVGSRINTGVVHVVGVVHVWVSVVTLIVEHLGVSFCFPFAEMVWVAIGVGVSIVNLWRVNSRVNLWRVHLWSVNSRVNMWIGVHFFSIFMSLQVMVMDLSSRNRNSVSTRSLQMGKHPLGISFWLSSRNCYESK
jgi:hypothetical protein